MTRDRKTDLQVVADATGGDAASLGKLMHQFELDLNSQPGMDVDSLASERAVHEGILECLQLPRDVVGHHTVASGAGATRSLRKLTAHKLDHFLCLRCSQFGDLAMNRVDMLKEVIREAATHGDLQHGVLGDTQHDIEAAKELGLPAVAIASGAFSTYELQRSGPDLLLERADAVRLREFIEAL